MRQSSSGFHAAVWGCLNGHATIDPFLLADSWWWLSSMAMSWCCYCVKILCASSQPCRGHSQGRLTRCQQTTACPLMRFRSRPGVCSVRCVSCLCRRNGDRLRLELGKSSPGANSVSAVSQSLCDAECVRWLVVGIR